MKADIKAKFETYQNLLKKWQPKINLISSNTLENAWQRHFEDSLQIAEYLPKGARTLFDLGSGAGFPGLVLAMLMPELNISLVESDQKKCSFLKTVSRETDTPVTIINARIEAVSSETAPDVIMARALASLSDLFAYCEKWIEANPELTLVFPKGARAEEELSELSKNWQYDCCTHQSKTDESAQILVFSKAARL